MDRDFRTFSSFDRDLRTSDFKVNHHEESLLGCINEGMTDAERYLEEALKTRNWRPSLIITGMPRTGSTYLYQTLACRLKVGYVSNLMARFYLAPVTGAWLQRRLLSDEIKNLNEFKSRHGVTRRIVEPHEFGYFWSWHLGFNGDSHEPAQWQIETDAYEALDRKLKMVSRVFGQPVVYKCMIAPFVLIHLLAHTQLKVLSLRRRREDVVQSVLRTREERLGSLENWWSIRPSGWREMLDRTPEEQVNWQYERVTAAIEAAGRDYPDRFLELDYESLVSNPDPAVSMVADFLNTQTRVTQDDL